MSSPIKTVATWTALIASLPATMGATWWIAIKPGNEAAIRTNNLNKAATNREDDLIWGIHKAPELNIHGPVAPVDPTENDPILWALSKKGQEFFNRLNIANPIYELSPEELRSEDITAIKSGLNNGAIGIASVKLLSELEEWSIQNHIDINKYLSSLNTTERQVYENLADLDLSKPYLTENHNIKTFLPTLLKLQTAIFEYRLHSK